MTTRRHRLTLAAAAGTLGLLVAAGAPFADAGPGAGSPGVAALRAAIGPGAAGTPGYCPTHAGVTVVVDFQQLGGGIVVRCAPGPVVPGFTGLDALQGGGFKPTGTERWGLAFICRIAGKPAPDQDIPIKGDRHYKEACIGTPPLAAYWSYWYAPNGGTWTFSQGGPMSRDAIPGGFEGWSFSLNHTQDGAPPPGIAPKRPPHTPPTTPPPTTPPSTTPPSHPPHTSPPPTHPPPTHPTHAQPTRQAGGEPTGASQTESPTTSASPSRPHHEQASSAGNPTTTPTQSTSTSDPVTLGHNAAGERVSGQLPDTVSTSSGSARTAVVGLVIVGLLALGGFATWRRRSGAG